MVESFCTLFLILCQMIGYHNRSECYRSTNEKSPFSSILPTKKRPDYEIGAFSIILPN